MLKRLFLGIIILSALASEGGASYSMNLIDYYLGNLAQLDMIQDSRNAISGFDAQKRNSLDRKGTPVAFFKAISQGAINSKVSNRNSHLGLFWMSGGTVVFALLIMSFICLNNKISFITRRNIYSLTDSSPPAYC